jgi:hypothetical protein
LEIKEEISGKDVSPQPLFTNSNLFLGWTIGPNMPNGCLQN